MRYRRDVSRGTDLNEVARHVAAHLAGAVHPEDDPLPAAIDVRVTINPHKDHPNELLTVVGEINGEPNAPYLRSGYNPETDHPEITFQPYEDPDTGLIADHSEVA